MSQPFCLKYEHFSMKWNSVFVVPVNNIPTNSVCSSLISPLASSIHIIFSAGGRLKYVCACDMYVSAMSELCQCVQALQVSHILKMKLHIQLQALAALSLVSAYSVTGWVSLVMVKVLLLPWKRKIKFLTGNEPIQPLHICFTELSSLTYINGER